MNKLYNLLFVESFKKTRSTSFNVWIEEMEVIILQIVQSYSKIIFYIFLMVDKYKYYVVFFIYKYILIDELY